MLVAAVVRGYSGGLGCRGSRDCLEGNWRGHWQSCTDQFKGTVNARITRCDARHYKAVFWGRAFKIMPYRYTVTLTACKSPTTGKIYFKCSRKIPFWGMYWMNGWASNCKFYSKYRTDDHTGYFVMRKVE